MRAPSQRAALAALFGVLTIAFVFIAAAALKAHVWVVAVAAAALGAWLGSLALRAVRSRP